MSGSTRYDYSGEERGSDDCTFRDITIVASPKAPVLAKVAKGDVLLVALEDGKLVVLRDGEVLGSLAFPGALKLRSCIEKGFNYEADVLSVAGGKCQVEIRNA